MGQGYHNRLIEQAEKPLSYPMWRILSIVQDIQLNDTVPTKGTRPKNVIIHAEQILYS
jgi:hypothetical protein